MTAPFFLAQSCSGDVRTGAGMFELRGARQRAEGDRRIERAEGRRAALGRPRGPVIAGEDARPR